MSHDLGAPEGIRGTAVHTTPRDRVAMFGTVVDEYVVAPRAVPEGMTVGQFAGHKTYVAALAVGADMWCVVYTLDGCALDRLRKLGLPVGMAGQLIAVMPMVTGALPVTWDQARMTVHPLVRGAVEGTLPLVDGPDAHTLWEAATFTVCRLVAGERVTDAMVDEVSAAVGIPPASG
jgi:hypothetical protein